MNMKVSVILTVKNEGESIRHLLDSLVAQARFPDEVIVSDGGSTDNTLAILGEYEQFLPIKTIVAWGSNISQGRNLAIKEASGPIIASTDAGVILAPDWLSELIRPIEEEGTVVVSGWFESHPQSAFEAIMGATVLPDLSDIHPEKFLPSSRSVAFLKSAWFEVGGYPEWLDYGEDLIFDIALRDRYGHFPFAPKAVVYFRPRGDIIAFARQYYLYARGDGKANLWPRRHAIRYFTYLVALPTLIWLIWKRKWLGWVLLLSGGGIYSRRPAQRLKPQMQKWPLGTRTLAFTLIPIIRLVGDLAKMAGYPAGLAWRWRKR